MTQSFLSAVFIRKGAGIPQSELLTRLSSDVLERADTFQSEKRREEFLWSRVVLDYLVKTTDRNAKVIERPPLSPAIDAVSPLFCSISHTGSFIGAALSSSPVAMDLEVINPRRPMAAIWGKYLPMDMWERIPDNQKTEAFFKSWGLFECAVKLPGKLSYDQKDIWVEAESSRVPFYHEIIGGNTMLTLTSMALGIASLEFVEPEDLMAFT